MLALAGLWAQGRRGDAVFDEIDAGVGGQTARAVGERLRELAEDAQVLCITHLPQVASLARRHFRIAKSVDGGQRRTVEPVAGDDLVGEIVRMLGGPSGRRGGDDATRASFSRRPESTSHLPEFRSSPPASGGFRLRTV